METTEANPTINNQHNIPLNPPSVEAAYKRKCIELKKRLNEIEAHNEEMRLRNMRGTRYIQKMRLESCMLLERLAVLTGDSEAKPADATNVHGESTPTNNRFNGSSKRRSSYGQGYVDDMSDGSSKGHPPTVCIHSCNS
jgi:hypothetical protein